MSPPALVSVSTSAPTPSKKWPAKLKSTPSQAGSDSNPIIVEDPFSTSFSSHLSTTTVDEPIIIEDLETPAKMEVSVCSDDLPFKIPSVPSTPRPLTPSPAQRVNLPKAVYDVTPGGRGNGLIEERELSHVEPEVVPRIPLEIDGWKVFVILDCKGHWHEVTSDARHFAMNTSSSVKLKPGDKRKTGECKGHYYCDNKRCPYLLQNKNQPNVSNFFNIGSTWKGCNGCKLPVKRFGCAARKTVVYVAEEEMAVVYHVGNHKCIPNPFSKSARSEAKKVIEEKAKTALECLREIFNCPQSLSA